MIKALLIDLDGTMIDSCDLHFDALNIALKENQLSEISKKDHQTIFNGLSTRLKLQKLLLSESQKNLVYKRKQEITKELFNKITKNQRLIDILVKLKQLNFKLYCASNCISETLNLVLKNLEIHDLFDFVVSNENLKNAKPSPEIYYKCFIHENLSPKECLVFEDSMIGITAGIALQS